MTVIVPATKKRAEESVEATLGGQTAPLVEAQVPFSHHVGGVACLLQLHGQGDVFQGQAVGLGGSNDGVLEACVDLIPAK